MDTDFIYQNKLFDIDKIIFVCGTRKLSSRVKSYDKFSNAIQTMMAVDNIRTNKFMLVHGDAVGCDKLSEYPVSAFIRNNFPIKKFPAKWINDEGQRDISAGLNRNIEMGEFLKKAQENKIDLSAIAFPLRKTLEDMTKKRGGTYHMMDVMSSLGIEYRVCSLDLN